MDNKVIEKFKKDVPTIGTITHMKSANAVEILGVTGLDYVLIDMEHCPVGIDEVNRYISAADAAQITPLVRTACHETAYYGRLTQGQGVSSYRVWKRWNR